MGSGTIAKIKKPLEELVELAPGSLIQLCPDTQSLMTLIPDHFMFEEFVVFNRRKLSPSDILEEIAAYRDVHGNQVILNSSGVTMQLNRELIPHGTKAPFGLYLGDIIVCKQGAAKITVFLKILWDENFYWCWWENDELTGKMVLQ